MKDLLTKPVDVEFSITAQSPTFLKHIMPSKFDREFNKWLLKNTHSLCLNNAILRAS